MLCNSMKFIIESDISKLRETLPAILDCVRNKYPFMSESDLMNVRLVLSELLVNAIIHGNNEDPSKVVELDVELEEAEIISLIRDEGNGFDMHGKLRREQSFNHLLRGHGRGLQLVDALTDSLHYDEASRTIQFRKSLAV